AGGNAATQDGFFAAVMNPWLKIKTSLAARLANGPTGKAPRDFLHVSLGVAAIHAEGVQLHQLAGVILIQPAASVIWRKSRDRGIRTGAQPIVQVEKHG